jgi:hypothetical protein
MGLSACNCSEDENVFLYACRMPTAAWLLIPGALEAIIIAQ